MKRCILHYLFRKTYTLFPFVLCVAVCCAVRVAPALGQGALVAKKVGSTSAAYGYYEYLPTNYYQKSKHPVIVFLSGIGEQGNGTTDLARVLKNGPPKLINKGEWPSSRPFIVIAPQSPSGFFDPDGLHEFINYITKTYKVDVARIYLTGLSAGGISTWNYLGAYQDQIAAAIPICGSGKSVANKAKCDFNNIAIWAFHGDSDPTVHVDGSIIAVENINACSSKPSPLAKLTIYPGVGHDSWTRTYDLSGMNSDTDGKYNPFNKNIYDWLLTNAREDATPPPPSSNQPPVADAGNDISVSQSTSKVILNGSNSYDPDGNIVSYSWTKISGPSASLSGAGSSQLTVTNLSAGTYNFKLTVKDENGVSNSDEVEITVNAANAENGLTYHYYEGSWNSLPDFSKLQVVKSGKVSNFSLSPRKRNNNFGFRFDGFIHIPISGEYTFFLTSDDGSQLSINEKLVVNNDGLHSNQERSGKITLSEGYHLIKVKFFEKKGDEILSIKYAGPGISKQSIPNGRLYTQKPSEVPPSSSGEQGVSFNYYEGNWEKLPDFSKLKAVKSGKVSSFRLSPRKRDDNFGFRFESYLKIDKGGEYTFYLTSDDGSSLYIDAKQVIDNDGLHGERERTGKIILSEGYHPIKVKFFEKTGNEILLVKYSGPGVGKQKIPNDKLFITKGTDASVAVNARSEQVTAENTLLENLKGGSIEIVSVYPNPVEDKIHVRFTEGEVGEINCKLFNYTGTDYQVSVENMQYTDGELVIDVSQWNLNAGIYLLQVTYHQAQQIFRIIKR